MSKVFCSNCGAEVIIPEHSHIASGITISEKDTVGTHYLPTKSKAEQRMEQLKANGVDISNFMILSGSTGESFLFKNDNGIPTPVADDDPLFNTIKNSGYVFNRFVDARWITAQMFQMLNSCIGYDDCLSFKGYDYQFKFLQDELHRLSRMEKENDPTLTERGQFFTSDVIYSILLDYRNKLEKYINHMPTYRCKGVNYKRIRGFKYGNNNYGDVFVSDLYNKLYNPLIRKINVFRYENLSYKTMSCEFDNFMNTYYIKLRKYEFRQAKAFRDSYKGLGAYYTCNNLIKYHGCGVYDEDGKWNTEKSLEILKAKAKEYKGEYWRLFAFMKKLIADNNFSPNWK